MSKLQQEQPKLIDKVSGMTLTHMLHTMPGLRNALEMSVLMMKVDLKRGGYQGTIRYYIIQLLTDR
jgi:hypothetical protein